MIQDNETAEQMASDLEQVDFNCLGTEAMFTSYDELNKGNDIDKEGMWWETGVGAGAYPHSFKRPRPCWFILEKVVHQDASFV